MKPKRILSRAFVLSIASSLLICNLTATVRFGHHAFAAPSKAARLAQIGSTRHRARTYDVQHYIIRTSFDVKHETVWGEVDVVLKPLSTNFRAFDLDAANMKIERVSLDSGSVLSSTVQANTLHITLDRSYQPSDNITVKIKYHTHPERGLYFISASHDDGFARPAQIWSQGEPEDNHYWFPCYDFPDDKATSEQYITTTKNELAIANGKLVETTDNENVSRTFHWKMEQPHSSYLISLVVGDYARLSDSYNGILLEDYTYHGTERQAHRVFDKTPMMISWFSQVLNYDFPYDRYAQTIVGNFIFGGMENITATTFADTEILSGGEGAMDSSKDNLVSHELAHSWFGDLVTCRDWSELWLNEGFATFMEAIFREHQDGREAYLRELQADARDYFMEDPASKRHPLVNPRYPLSMELFDATTYKKGAFVIHMLRETVGDETFWKAINVYLNEFKYANVDSHDLQRVFEKVSGQDLGWFFDQWVFKAGYPELRVRSRYLPANRRLILDVAQTQRASNITPAVFRLFVDVEIVTARGRRIERIEINRRTQTFTIQLDRRPKAVTFDKGSRILKKIFFQQSRSTAAYLMNDGLDQLAPSGAPMALMHLNGNNVLESGSASFSPNLFLVWTY